MLIERRDWPELEGELGRSAGSEPSIHTAWAKEEPGRFSFFLSVGGAQYLGQDGAGAGSPMFLATKAVINPQTNRRAELGEDQKRQNVPARPQGGTLDGVAVGPSGLLARL